MLISGDVQLVHLFYGNDDIFRAQMSILTITELFYVKNYHFYNFVKNNFHILSQ